MDKDKILQKENIPDEEKDLCYVSDLGQIFRPLNGRTGEEVYNEWIENKDKQVEKEPSEQEKLNAQLLQQNAEMQIELDKQKQLNAEMLLQIAQLGGNTNV